MIIKAILISLIALIFFYFLANMNKVMIKAWKRIALIGLLLFGVVAVIFPDIVDRVAKYIGIGRGADLLLYTTSLAFVFVTLNIYVKFRETELKQGKAISKLAILEKKSDDHR